MNDSALPLSVPVDHPAYAGHFPGQPILPGVVLLDLALHRLAASEGLTEKAGRLQAAKFPSPVWPGEALQLQYRATAQRTFQFQVVAGGRVAASGIYVFSTPETGGQAR